MSYSLFLCWFELTYHWLSCQLNHCSKAGCLFSVVSLSVVPPDDRGALCSNWLFQGKWTRLAFPWALFRCTSWFVRFLSLNFPHIFLIILYKTLVLVGQCIKVIPYRTLSFPPNLSPGRHDASQCNLGGKKHELTGNLAHHTERQGRNNDLGR